MAGGSDATVVEHRYRIADDLFEKLLFKEVNGEKIERRTRQPRDEKSRAVHGTRSRARPHMFPAKSPFKKGLQSKSREPRMRP